MSAVIRNAYEQGLANSTYDLFGMLGIVVSIGFSIWYGRKLCIKWWKTAIVLVAVLATSFFSTHTIILDCLSHLEKYTSFPMFHITSIIRTLLLMPMVGFWLSKMLKEKWSVICDLLAFVPLIIGSIGCFGCLFTGCCRGYPWIYGIYNPRIQTNVFPVQILNAGTMITIAVYLFIRIKRRKYESDGLMYPIMLILFGSTRFFTEFLCENQKSFLGCSALSIHALKDCIVGIIVYILICNRNQRNNGVASCMQNELGQEKG